MPIYNLIRIVKEPLCQMTEDKSQTTGFSLLPSYGFENDAFGNTGQPAVKRAFSLPLKSTDALKCPAHGFLQHVVKLQLSVKVMESDSRSNQDRKALLMLLGKLPEGLAIALLRLPDKNEN